VLRWMHHDTAMRTWLFLDDVEHVAALGLHAGDERAGVWRLEHHQNATGRRALVNHQGDADASPATAVWKGSVSSDVLVRTRCTVARTGREQACGVVFGWKSERDHWIARVDVAGSVVAVGVVEDGVERVLATAPISTTDVPWHEIVVTTQGDRIVVDHDGGAQIEVVDVAARRRGGVGLWAPAATTAYFDELTVQSLDRSYDLLDAVS